MEIRNELTTAVVRFMATSPYSLPNKALIRVVLPTDTYPITATRISNMVGEIRRESIDAMLFISQEDKIKQSFVTGLSSIFWVYLRRIVCRKMWVVEWNTLLNFRSANQIITMNDATSTCDTFLQRSKDTKTFIVSSATMPGT